MRTIALLAYNALRILTWPLWMLWRRSRRPKAPWVVLAPGGRLEELPRPRGPLQRLLRPPAASRLSMHEVRSLCERLASDPRVHGLLLRLEGLSAPYPVLASLRLELQRLRAAGKQVVCYLPLGGDDRVLYVASGADRVLAMPHAGFSSLGPAASRTYLAALLARLGIEVVVTAEGRFKTAAEPLVRESMSEPEREQLEAIVRTTQATWMHALAERVAGGEAGAASLLEHGLYGSDTARSLRLIDGTAYDDELSRELAAGKSGFVPHPRYLARGGAPPATLVPLRRRPAIALVRLVGTIRERPSGGGIDLHGTASLLRKLARMRSVAGVILHVDSPGGSAVVSELLHREIRQLDAQKPVVTWMGAVAASGGYYLAAASRAIIAEATTLTGSIGVVSLQVVAEHALRNLNVRRDVVSLAPHADLHSLARVPSEPERALLRAETTRFYRRFVEVVAEGRRLSFETVAQLAEGRVWSGADAHRHGLVDALGGYREARARLEQLLGQQASALLPKPLLMSPPRLEAAPPVPEPEGQAVVARELAELRELGSLLASGERVFTYALALPQLR